GKAKSVIRAMAKYGSFILRAFRSQTKKYSIFFRGWYMVDGGWTLCLNPHLISIYHPRLLVMLFRPQTIHRIRQRGFNALITDREQSDQDSAQHGCPKNPPGYSRPVIVIQQPVMHEIIRGRNGDDQG